jgi:hypothetical protein
MREKYKLNGIQMPLSPRWGSFPFSSNFSNWGGRFDPWVEDCPLEYFSNNAPQKIDVLGSLFLSTLTGHSRYAHITSLMSDRVNSSLLGMSKVVSNDSARRALQKIEEQPGIAWLQAHLQSCYAPLLKTPWMLMLRSNPFMGTRKELKRVTTTRNLGGLHIPFIRI